MCPARSKIVRDLAGAIDYGHEHVCVGPCSRRNAQDDKAGRGCAVT